MKKALLLSVVASTMIMAGGDIAPVEVVAEETSAWEFNGEAVVYYQTIDGFGAGSLFDQGPVSLVDGHGASAANVGLRFGAVNKDLFWGVGVGAELVGLGTLGLEDSLVSGVMQSASSVLTINPVTGTVETQLNSGAWTQGYLTYGFGNTSLKVGRQTLPKGLSPFAFSETWNVFQNTFEAALVVNTDIPDTAVVYAYVARANSHTDLSEFNDINGEGNGVHMLTVQNKSFENVTLTGTWYYAPDLFTTEDANILWADAQFSVSSINIGLQGGTILGAGDTIGGKDTSAFGAQVGGDFGMFNASLAYSYVNDGSVPIFNLANIGAIVNPSLIAGAGVAFTESPLYTQMLANVLPIATDNDTFVARVGMDALGGNFSLAYGYTANNILNGFDYQEVDVAYTANITDSVSILAAYVYSDVDTAIGDGSNDLIRFTARYNF